MTTKHYNIHNEAEMADLAAMLAPLLQKGDVVTLNGGLGSGKTSFCRALINALSPVLEEVPSPTFTLVQVYDLPTLSLWHFDLYRLNDEARDILELGWEEALRYGVSLVEWPERLGSLLPPSRLEIRIAFDSEKECARSVTFTPFGAWQSRLLP
jgi:tRNA threonylcarbamoyl adenosine modification protein YjeE